MKISECRQGDIVEIQSGDETAIVRLMIGIGGDGFFGRYVLEGNDPRDVNYRESRTHSHWIRNEEEIVRHIYVNPTAKEAKEAMDFDPLRDEAQDKTRS